ncbi:hypothetical protein GQ457_06G010990 [Hibiscus cannabinus]
MGNRIYPSPNVLGLKSGSKPTNGVGLLPVGLAPGMDHSWGWDLLGRVDRIRVHELNRFINKKVNPLFFVSFLSLFYFFSLFFSSNSLLLSTAAANNGRRRRCFSAVVRRVSGHARIPTEASRPPLPIPRNNFMRCALNLHENGFKRFAFFIVHLTIRPSDQSGFKICGLSLHDLPSERWRSSLEPRITGNHHGRRGASFFSLLLLFSLLLF